MTSESAKNDFPIERLERTITPEAQSVIGGMILAWASYDTLVTYWMLQTFKVPLDEGSILIGSMDLKGRLGRIRTLHSHRTDVQGANLLKRLEKFNEVYAEVRNTIAHQHCVGMMLGGEPTLAFQSVRRVHGLANRFEMSAIPVAQIAKAGEFAEQAAAWIKKVTDARAPPPESGGT